MSDPWAEFRAAPAAPSVAPSGDQWSAFRPAPPREPWQGGVLPLSSDEKGNLSFDSNAGIVGSLKRMVTTPGDVMSGKLDLKTDEGFGRALELSLGMSPVPPAVRAAKMGVMKPEVPAPTAQALKEAADQGYTAVRGMGVDYSPRAVVDMVGGLKTSLEKDGLLAELAPNTHSIINKLSSPPEGSVINIQGLEAARRAAGIAAKDFTKPGEQLAASRLIQGIDDFIAKADPRSVVAGPAAEAGETIVKARANSAAQKRSDTITGIEERADLKAAATNSGRNLDNTIRQRVTDVVVDPKKSRGFNAEEIGSLEGVVNGDWVRNGLRNYGNMFGGGGGLGALIAGLGTGAMSGTALGTAAGGVVGAAVPATAMVAKVIQNSMARRALGKVDEATRMRSPEHVEAVANALMQPRDMLGVQSIMTGGGMSALNNAAPIDPKHQAVTDALLKVLAAGGT